MINKQGNENGIVFNYTSFLADRLRLLSNLSFSRVLNYMLIILSWGVSKLTGKLFLWGYPFSLSLETASVCNLSCPECMAGLKKTHRRNKLMSLNLCAAKLQIHRKNAFYCNLYAQGEPFLNSELFKIIGLARKNKYYSVVSTNGHFLSDTNCQALIDSKLDRLIVSLDGTDPKSYAKYRQGGRFNLVTEGIQRLSALKEKTRSLSPLLVVQFLVHKDNEHQLISAPSFIRSLGADLLQFKSLQIYSQQGHTELIPANPKFNRYLKATQSHSVAKSFNCFRVWSQAVYNSDGELVPCCFDKIPEYPLGVEEKNRDDLWKSDQFQAFRKKILSNPGSVNICKNCTCSPL